MAGTTGLEPATSAVTGQRSNQLSYVPYSRARNPNGSPGHTPTSLPQLRTKKNSREGVVHVRVYQKPSLVSDSRLDRHRSLCRTQGPCSQQVAESDTATPNDASVLRIAPQAPSNLWLQPFFGSISRLGKLPQAC